MILNQGDSRPSGDQSAADANPGSPKASDLPASVTFVHGAIGVGDVRICARADNALHAEPSDNVIPASNYPGLPSGGAALWRSGASDAAGMLEAFAVDAAGLGKLEHNLSSPFGCKDLADNPIIQKTPIAALPFAAGGPTVLTLVGCAPGAGSAESCGDQYDPNKGNLHFIATRIQSPTQIPGGQMALEFVNVSPSLQAKLAGATGRFGSCSGANLTNSEAITLGNAVPKNAAQTMLPAEAVFDSDGPILCAGNGATLVRASFARSQALGDPLSVPSQFYTAESTFVFVAVGDANASAGPEALHILALRFTPTR